MIGIRGIASYIPEGGRDNLRRAVEFGETSSFVRDKVGALRLPIKSDSQDASDLAVEAVRALSNRYGIGIENLDALVVVTQTPDGYGLPHTAAIVHRKLEMSSRVAAFDVSLGCSGYVYGLSILRGLMDQASLKNGVLITSDPYSKIINQQSRTTALLFGDAATATWLSESPCWTFGQPLLETDGAGSENLFVDGHRELRMNGRQVFNFAARRIPEQITRFVDLGGFSLDDIDLFCLHQGSKAIVDAIARQFPGVEDRFVRDILDTGNTVSSSIPILLEKHALTQDVDRVLICGFGVGLSWATNIIERVKQ